MDFVRPTNANLRLAETQDEFVTIDARREVAEFADTVGGTFKAHRIVTAFRPSAEELAALVAGELLYLSIMGLEFPPVLITVGDPNPEYRNTGNDKSEVD